MLKIYLFLSLASALVFALPLDSRNAAAVNKNKEVQTLRNEFEDLGDGAYRFYYETSDGQKRMEESQVYEVEGEDPYTVVTGYYSYFGPDGVEYKVEYTADQNGYQATGEHLPNVETTTDEAVGLPQNAINSLLG